MRLDLKVSEILNQSRNKSAELIKKGFILVDGEIIRKPSLHVDEKNSIDIEETSIYVSRAGEKLSRFLKEYDLEVEDKNCLDIGSSTGGFVEVLLKCGAKRVVAVDVGSEQLHGKLKNNEKIELFEKTDIRSFESEEKFDIVTCDVSFISFKDVAKSIDKFAKKDIIILFKPQFEVGREIKRDRRGVVKDEKAVKNAMDKFEELALGFGWIKKEKIDSQVKGKEGNLEIFYAFEKR